MTSVGIRRAPHAQLQAYHRPPIKVGTDGWDKVFDMLKKLASLTFRDGNIKEGAL
jgi:hypothetical protein